MSCRALAKSLRPFRLNVSPVYSSGVGRFGVFRLVYQSLVVGHPTLTTGDSQGKTLNRGSWGRTRCRSVAVLRSCGGVRKTLRREPWGRGCPTTLDVHLSVPTNVRCRFPYEKTDPLPENREGRPGPCPDRRWGRGFYSTVCSPLFGFTSSR